MRSIALFLISVAVTAAAQPKQFDFVAQAEQRYRIQPDLYYPFGPFTSSSSAEPVRVRADIEAKSPVLIGVVTHATWTWVAQRRLNASQLQYWCLQQNVLKMQYRCDLPSVNGPYVVVVHDMRGAGDVVIAGLAVAIGVKEPAQNLLAANDVSVTAFTWECVKNCQPEVSNTQQENNSQEDPWKALTDALTARNQQPKGPVWSWVDVMKDKFALTQRPRFYGPVSASKDKDQYLVRIKAPVPMIAAFVPSADADVIRKDATKLNSILAKTPCRQRGAQKLQFACALDLTDGQVEVLIAPEDNQLLPNEKKANFSVARRQCVAGCEQQ